MSEKDKTRVELSIKDALDALDTMPSHFADQDLHSIISQIEAVRVQVDSEGINDISVSLAFLLSRVSGWSLLKVLELEREKYKILNNPKEIRLIRNRHISSQKAEAKVFLMGKAWEAYQLMGSELSAADMADSLYRDHLAGKYSEIAGMNVSKTELRDGIKQILRTIGKGKYIKPGRPTEKS